MLLFASDHESLAGLLALLRAANVDVLIVRTREELVARSCEAQTMLALDVEASVLQRAVDAVRAVHPNLSEAFARIRVAAIQEAVKIHGSQRAAATALGIARRSLQYALEKVEDASRST